MNHVLRKSFCSKLIIFIAGCAIQAKEASAQKNMDYAVHANIIYQFTKYIDWPDNEKNGDFVIGVLGDCPLYDQLKSTVLNKSVGQQKIVVRKVSVSSDLNCQILFIPDESVTSIKRVLSKTAGKSTLLVSETEGYAKKGSCINFVTIRDHLKLEINKNNIEERRLHIANDLLRLAVLVQ